MHAVLQVLEVDLPVVPVQQVKAAAGYFDFALGRAVHHGHALGRQRGDALDARGDVRGVHHQMELPFLGDIDKDIVQRAPLLIAKNPIDDPLTCLSLGDIAG